MKWCWTVFLFPEPRTCSVKPCGRPSSCSTWCRRPWRPTTSSCPTLRGTRPTPLAALAQTRWRAAPPPASTTPPRGWAGTVRKTTSILTRWSTWIRRTATQHSPTQPSRPPSRRRDTSTRLRGRWPPRQRQASLRRSGGGWTSSWRKVREGGEWKASSVPRRDFWKVLIARQQGCGPKTWTLNLGVTMKWELEWVFTGPSRDNCW